MKPCGNARVLERALKKPPKVIGHRGAAGRAPENTLASIAKAADIGCGWVEFDVMLAACATPVVIHDETLDRTTDGHGPVAAKTITELKTLDAGSWFSADFAGVTIPALSEALALLSRLGLGAVVEIKPLAGMEAETGRIAAEVLAAFSGASMPGLMVSSFSPEALVAARSAAPEIPRALNVGAVPAGWRKAMDGLGCRALHCQAGRLKKKEARDIIAAGFELRCYTVNRAAEAEKLFSWGVAGVFSDFPDRIELRGQLT